MLTMTAQISKLKNFVRYSSKLADIFRKEGIVPEIVNCAPQDQLKILYPTGALVDCGNEIAPTLVRNCPIAHWYAEYIYFYTICLIDPDVPSRKDPCCRSWKHWLVGNIPGSCVDSGDILAEYIGACPQEETDLHRYVFLVYRQPQRCCFVEPRLPNNSFMDREGFSIREFAGRYNLGEPVAGNYFVAQFDCYVQLLNKQIGYCD